MTDRFSASAWAKYVEFCGFLGSLYLLMFFVFGQVGFQTWPLHPAIPLVAVFASLHGLLAGMAMALIAALAYVAMELPSRQINVTRVEHLSEASVFISIISAAALVLGAIRDRSAERARHLEDRAKALADENNQLRAFAQESATAIERHDLSQAFGGTQKTFRLFHALDTVYLSDRKTIKRDLASLLNEILPGIEFDFLNSEKKAILTSRNKMQNGMRSANLPSGPSDKRQVPQVEVQAPVMLPDIIPDARWLSLSSQSGVSEHDLRVCLKVIHRCLIRDELVLDLESRFENRVS